MQYQFILKDNNQKAFGLFVWFLFFLQLVALCLVALNTINKDTKLGLYIFLGVYLAISIIYLLFQKNSKAFETYSIIMAVLYAYFWLKYAGVIALFLFVLVYLLATTVKYKKTIILFSKDGVHFKRVFKTMIYPWQKIDNVVLKDNLLTIDLVSNKLIQAEIIELTDPADEKLFNRFCAEQLRNGANLQAGNTQ